MRRRNQCTIKKADVSAFFYCFGRLYNNPIVILRLVSWHIYPQDDDVHLEKLHAFWEKSGRCYPPELLAEHQLLSDELNGGAALSASGRLNAWRQLWQQRDIWQKSCADWQQSLFSQPSALEKLAKFTEDTLK